MDTSDLLDALDIPFKFRTRPTSLPADLRPTWRLAVLALILERSCKGGRATLRKLHVLNWAIRSKESRGAFLKLLAGDGDPDAAIVRFEPALNRAIDLARGERLVVRESGDRVQLTPLGALFVNEIEKSDNCLVEERNFLRRVGKIGETRISNLLKMGV